LTPVALYGCLLFDAVLDVLAEVFEEIMFQNRGNLYEQCRVNALALENAVYISSVATKLFCKPGCRKPLFVEPFLDDASDVYHSML
jgi:hypothetical protein